MIVRKEDEHDGTDICGQEPFWMDDEYRAAAGFGGSLPLVYLTPDFSLESNVDSDTTSLSSFHLLPVPQLCFAIRALTATCS